MKLLLRKLTLLLSIYAGSTSADAYASPYCPDDSKYCYRSVSPEGTGQGFLGCCKVEQICSVDPVRRTHICLDIFSSESEYRACLAAAERQYRDCRPLATSEDEMEYCDDLFDQAEANCKASWPDSQDDSGQTSEEAPPLNSPPQDPDEEQQDDDDDEQPDKKGGRPWKRNILDHPFEGPQMS
jgi:hypothetical protein